MSFKLADYDYDLPPELIAQEPAKERGGSRLLVVDRREKTWRHFSFCDLPLFLKAGDLLVFNDTKVIPARLAGRRKTGGRVEILLLEHCGRASYRALIKPLGRLKKGEEIVLDGGYVCRLRDPLEKIIEFPGADIGAMLKKIGSLPLPPYIRRAPSAADARRYQTIFAKKEGAVAAPTAGLHFTKKLLDEIRRKGVSTAFVTLHVNYATFSPVRSEDIREHQLREEVFEIPAPTVRAVRAAKKRLGRVIAVGTTVTKVLEDSADVLSGSGKAEKICRASSLFIHPPFSFRIVDALVTNFHLPRTSLLMLVSAFAGRDLILRAYREAMEKKYAFFSYGDAMLIL